MRTLVTGADGLLGANLVRVLQARGHEVRALVQPASPARTLRGLDLEVACADLVESDDTTIERSLQGCDAVLHTAGLTDVRASAARMWRVNFEGTRRLVDASRRRGVERFIHTGSASSLAFSGPGSRGDEKGGFPTAYRGIAYMESKARASAYVLASCERRELDGVVVAPTFMLGPFDERPSSGELIRRFLAHPTPAVSPGGRNFVHVGDVAEAMVNALTQGTTGDTYLLGGENLSYQAFFSLVAELGGARPPRVVLPQALVLAAGYTGSAIQHIVRRPVPFNRTLARFACLEAYYDSSKATEQLQLPRTPVREAVRESIQSLRKYGHLPS